MREHHYAYPTVVELRSARTAADQRLIELSQELLDAHCDTVCMADEDLADGRQWSAHVRYLRDLQRVAQRTLAELAVSLA